MVGGMASPGVVNGMMDVCSWTLPGDLVTSELCPRVAEWFSSGIMRLSRSMPQKVGVRPAAEHNSKFWASTNKSQQDEVVQTTNASIRVTRATNK